MACSQYLSTEQAAGSKEFVLCFDGTGYKFRGDESDSNVLKIYRVCRYIPQLRSTGQLSTP